LISHDVYFIQELANHVVHIQDGHLTHYPGDYQYYLDKTAALRAVAERAGGRSCLAEDVALAPNRPVQERRERKRRQAEQRQTQHRELKAARDLVTRLEQEIAGHEARQAELTVALEQPETYAQSGRAVEINLEIKSLLADLPRLTAEWEAAATRLATLESAKERSAFSLPPSGESV